MIKRVRDIFLIGLLLLFFSSLIYGQAPEDFSLLDISDRSDLVSDPVCSPHQDINFNEYDIYYDLKVQFKKLEPHRKGFILSPIYSLRLEAIQNNMQSYLLEAEQHSIPSARLKANMELLMHIEKFRRLAWKLENTVAYYRFSHLLDKLPDDGMVNLRTVKRWTLGFLQKIQEFYGSFYYHHRRLNRNYPLPNNNLSYQDEAASLIRHVEILSEHLIMASKLYSHEWKLTYQNTAAKIRMATIGVLGVLGIYSAIQFSTPFVAALSSAGASIAGNTGAMGGIILGGCTFGALGAMSVRALEESYLLLSKAYVISENNNTSFSCELRQIAHKIDLEHNINDLNQSAGEGAIAGCSVISLASLFPKLALYIVGAAIGTGTLYQGGSIVYHVYEYINLKYFEAVSAAERGDELEARRLLNEARFAAREIGAHAIETFILAIIAKEMFADFRHLLHKNAKEMASILSIASDDVPVAMDSATSFAKMASNLMKTGRPASTGTSGSAVDDSDQE